MDVRNNFCYLCKKSVVINGKPNRGEGVKRNPYLAFDISLLCECGSTFNLYLVRTQRQMHRSKYLGVLVSVCVCGNTCWFRFVWLLLLPLSLSLSLLLSKQRDRHTHVATRALHLSAPGEYIWYDIYVCVCVCV